MLLKWLGRTLCKLCTDVPSHVLAGIIDAFQRALLCGQPPDFATLWPGMALTAILLPISYLIFKRAEDYFADVI